MNAQPDGPYAQSALAHVEAGWYPVPVEKKQPVPAGWTGYVARKVTRDDAERWIEQGLGKYNVGLRLMYEIGIDIDAYDPDKNAKGAWEEIVAAHGAPPPTVRVSARFGADYDGLSGIRVYRLPKVLWEYVEQKKWFGVAGSGIDVINLGQRTVVAWPSQHKSGGTYQYLDERTGQTAIDGPLPAPETLPELSEAWVRAVLLKPEVEASDAADGKPKAEKKERLPGSADSKYWTDGKPCQAVATAMGEVLRAMPYNHHGALTKGLVPLTRLGEQGHRGVAKAVDRLLAEFTLAVGDERDEPVEDEWLRMVSGLDSIIETKGLTPEDKRGCCVLTEADIDAMVAAAWDDPMPLETDAEPVPLDSLPEVVRDVVVEVSKQAQASPEIALNAALGVLSAAARGAYVVQVHSGWTAGPTALYGMSIASSGERKDAATNPIVAPLHALEATVAMTVKTDAFTARALVKKYQNDALAAEKKGDVVTQVHWEQEADKIAPREPLHYLLNDVTTEALGAHMTAQRGSVCIFSTEATAFSTVAGAYSDKPNLGLLNNAYDGAPYRDGRVSRASIDVTRPILTWCAAVQPSVLEGYASRDTEGSGFLARFLYFLPRPMEGTRFGAYAAAKGVLDAWEAAVGRLHEASWDIYSKATENPYSVGAPEMMWLSDDAQRMLMDLADGLERRKGDFGDLAQVRGWIEKHPARLARIAALFALLEDPAARVVRDRHMAMVIPLSEPFIAHAREALGLLRGNRGVTEERVTLQALGKKWQGEPVATRDLQQALRGQSWVQGVEDVRAALERLASMGWVRRTEVPAGAKGGRPSERWTPHPSVTRGHTASSVASPAAEGSVGSVTIVSTSGDDPLKSPSLTKSEITDGAGDDTEPTKPATTETGEATQPHAVIASDDEGAAAADDAWLDDLQPPEDPDIAAAIEALEPLGATVITTIGVKAPDHIELPPPSQVPCLFDGAHDHRDCMRSHLAKVGAVPCTTEGDHDHKECSAAYLSQHGLWSA